MRIYIPVLDYLYIRTLCFENRRKRNKKKLINLHTLYSSSTLFANFVYGIKEIVII